MEFDSQGEFRGNHENIISPNEYSSYQLSPVEIWEKYGGKMNWTADSGQ
jgi:hypothetical protein